MGLDSLLYRAKKDDIDRYLVKEGASVKLALPDSWNLRSKVLEELEEVSSWRKCYQIHRWFANAVQHRRDDGGFYLVTKQQLDRLLWKCIQISNTDNSKSLAKKLLPIPMFGLDDYDRDYFLDVEYSVRKLKKVINSTNWSEDCILYHASW